MNQTYIKYHSQISRKGIYYNNVKLLLALSIVMLAVELSKCFRAEPDNQYIHLIYIPV